MKIIATEYNRKDILKFIRENSNIKRSFLKLLIKLEIDKLLMKLVKSDTLLMI